MSTSYGDVLAVAATDVEAARQVARRYASAVRSRLGQNVRSIRLFGSAARGDWTTESDVDVLVLLQTMSQEDEDVASQVAYRLGVLETGVLLRPLVMTESQFSQLFGRERRIALDIAREGIDL
jgi:uncharacterized protein